MPRKTKQIATGAVLMLLLPAPATTARLAARASEHATRYPTALVVIGDSGATGIGSHPAHPFRHEPQNSWELMRATGLSLRYVSQIRRGEKVPHPRHWTSILSAAVNETCAATATGSPRPW